MALDLPPPVLDNLSKVQTQARVFSRLVCPHLRLEVLGEVAVKEKGVVKWFNNAKGYGFIQRQTGEDVFVHYSAIQSNGYRTLEEGREVEFECKPGPKGLHAENVSAL
jgi:CspA family cold shock protein